MTRIRLAASIAMVAIGMGSALSLARSSTVAPVQRPAGANAQPQLGTQITPLPDGAGKVIADAACLSCHSSDIIRQQRLTKAQWTATLTKMINWGTVIPEGQRDVLLDYLAANFGPENASFQPVVTRPVGR
jgi:hypothetical protein